jgi:Uma2 family endonuclease
MQSRERDSNSTERSLNLEKATKRDRQNLNDPNAVLVRKSVDSNQIAGNFYTALNSNFKRLDYRVFINHIGLWISKKKVFTYPDVMLVAGEPEYEGDCKDTITNPLIILEVFSESTKSCDRGEKFEIYRAIPTFQEYLLIDQNRIYIEQFFKLGKKEWMFCEYNQHDKVISLTSVEFQILLSDIYNKVNIKIDNSSSDTE